MAEATMAAKRNTMSSLPMIEASLVGTGVVEAEPLVAPEAEVVTEAEALAVSEPCVRITELVGDTIEMDEVMEVVTAGGISVSEPLKVAGIEVDEAALSEVDEAALSEGPSVVVEVEPTS